MRVALFAETFLPKTDGVVTTTCHLLLHLSRRNHQAIVLAPDGAPSEFAGAHVLGLTGFNFPLYPELRLASPFAHFDHHLAAFQPDIVHLINPALLGAVGLRYARRNGLPIVASYHTDIPGYAEHYYGLSALREPIWTYFRWIHNQADLNYCPSSYTQVQLLERGFERVKVWPHGVDTLHFSPVRRRREWRIRLCGGDPSEAERPLLIYVGRLAAEKRVDWLCPLIEALPGVRLAIVGDGPMRRSLEEHFAGTPTVFTGFLRGDDLAHAYASADLFVFPSASETFGNVVLEAMASGRPAIATRWSGPLDFGGGDDLTYWIDANKREPAQNDAGIQVVPSMDALVCVMRRCAENPQEVFERGIRASRHVHAKWRWEKKVMEVLFVLRKYVPSCMI